jgi:type II secretory pathway pseudopilin PulG
MTSELLNSSAPAPRLSTSRAGSSPVVIVAVLLVYFFGQPIRNTPRRYVVGNDTTVLTKPSRGFIASVTLAHEVSNAVYTYLFLDFREIGITKTMQMISLKKMNLAVRHGGTTLIELSVVIAVLLLLVGVLFIGITAWKNGANTAACVINLSSIQKAARGYANMNQLNTGAWLPITTLTTAGFWGTVPNFPAGGTYTPKTAVPLVPTETCFFAQPYRRIEYWLRSPRLADSSATYSASRFFDSSQMCSKSGLNVT